MPDLIETPQPTPPRLWTVLGRGLKRKCPRCGKGRLFKRWVTLHHDCDVCGLEYLRDQGDLWGYLLLIDRAVFIFPLIVLIYLGIANPHSVWTWLFVAVMLVTLIATMPQRNGMSIALEYFIRTHWGDLAQTGKRANTRPDL